MLVNPEPDPRPAAHLDESMLAADPISQFSRWFAEAREAGFPEPSAMVLATVSPAGQPHARTVLLKNHSAAGFEFYTNRTSVKGQDLAAESRASLLFPWYALQRQVRVEGRVAAMTQEQSEPYFHSRPHGSQVGAWASRQSTVLRSRAELEERWAELERRWPDGTEVPLPGFWGGYLLVPDSVEFWQGRLNRLHDRLRYRTSGTGWTVERLSP